MIEIDIKFIDASDWQELSWYSSGGTRAKKILQSPDGAEYYFKCSERKEDENGNLIKEYKYEFWNEIIAYQIGKVLGLNMLRYDVAIYKEEIGCLSPKMNVTDDEQLIEVGRFMTALNDNFLPEKNSARKEYTFQLLEKTIKEFNLSKYWELFFQTLLFDAIIGNTDRHQENWAFLGKTTFFEKGLELAREDIKKKRRAEFGLMLKNIFKKDKEKLNPELFRINLKLVHSNINSFAPIYDSGSSLVRELTDKKIEQLLNDEIALEKYINKGFAELHWNKEKLNHFKLIENLLNSSYLEVVKKSAEFLANWNEDLVSLILNNLDKDLPEKWHDYRIPNNRKNLITKIVYLRSKKLKEILK